MRRALLAVVVLAAATYGVSAPALACSVVFPGPTEAELLAQAHVVFEGVAGSHRDPNEAAPIKSTGDPIFWTFAVDQQIKGAVGPVVEVASARSSATCGITFQEGARYRVFATYQNGVLTTALGSGTRLAPVTPPTTTVPPAPPATPTPRRIALTG